VFTATPMPSSRMTPSRTAKCPAIQLPSAKVIEMVAKASAKVSGE